MLLLVSVRDPWEASAAAVGGADIVDAKDPAAGALGAVGLDMLHRISAAASHLRPVSAALGDADDEERVEHEARASAAAGATFVKIGFSGVSNLARARSLATAAVRGARHVILAGYADAPGSLSAGALLDIAVRTGARGVLLDTLDKHGPGLRALVDGPMLADWTRRAQAAGLLVALAGRLTEDDLPFVRDLGADIAGVRGAACDGGRTGRINPARVRELHHIIRAERQDTCDVH